MSDEERREIAEAYANAYVDLLDFINDNRMPSPETALLYQFWGDYEKALGATAPALLALIRQHIEDLIAQGATTP